MTNVKQLRYCNTLEHVLIVLPRRAPDINNIDVGAAKDIRRKAKAIHKRLLPLIKKGEKHER